MRGMAMTGLGLFIFSAILVSVHALTVEAPAKQIQVARGSNATLRCNFKTNSVADTRDLVVWKKINSKVDAVTRYFDGLVQYGEGYDHRIQFSGDVNSGDISITIAAVTMEDNGTYVCSVRLRDDPPRESALLDLFVLVAPSKPECKILGTPEYGQTINLTCVSHEGSPTPQYTWKSFNVQNEPRLLPHTEGRESLLAHSHLISAFLGAPMAKPCGNCPLVPQAGWLPYCHYRELPSVLSMSPCCKVCRTPSGQQITLKNVSADTSGFYICTSTNVVGTAFCNMTVSVVPPSMNIALYAGIIGGVVAAIVVIGIIAYCCCCREGKDTDYEITVQEDRNEPSRQMPTRHESIGEDVENA